MTPSYHWYETPEYQLWQQQNGGSPAASAPLRVTVDAGSTPSGGHTGYCDLVETGENTALNTISGSMPPWSYEAGHEFALTVVAPAFSAGLLQLNYAELDITNVAGTQRIAAGVDTPREIASGEGFGVVFDDLAEAGAQVGTDLVVGTGNNTISTTAGGIFVVSFFLQFIATGLVP